MATIRKRGDRWHVQVRRKGSQTLTRSFAQKRDADRWARDIETAIDQSRLPADPRTLSSVTLGDLVERYRDAVTPTKRQGDIEKVRLNAFLRHPICAKRLSDLSTVDFAAYRDERLAQVKPTTIKRELGSIRHLFRVALEEWGFPLPANPLDRLRLHAPDQRRDRRLRPEEFDNLIEAAKRLRNPLILPIILIALETGMRRGEILAIRRDDIDLNQKALRIPQSKNGHPRTIPLTTKTIALLEPFMGREGKLFPISANALRLSWERLRRRAKIEGLHFHDLRHETISRFFERGLTIPEAASISGHRDARMLFRYAHARPDDVLRKLQKDRSGA
jgi:integrase